MPGFPEGVLVREFSIGGAEELPFGDPLVHEVELRASRDLIWTTGEHIYTTPKMATSTPGEAVVFTEAVTDQAGWRTTRGEVIDLTAPNSYTHQYTAIVRVLRGQEVVRSFTTPPFVLPYGTGTPIRYEDLINADAVPGLRVSLPDTWSAQMAQAVGEAGSHASAASASAVLADEARAATLALVTGANVEGIVADYLTTNPPTADLTGYVETTDPRLADARTPAAHTHDDRYYTETETNTLLAGKQAAGSYAAASHNHDGTYSPLGHNHTGTYAPALGPDDNYVTDAEKANLHTHPAVIAQGATAAAARTAIGAGTSSFSGAYADLTGKPTLGTAAATASTDYATAAQGAKADTALQPATGQAINAQTGTTYTLVAGDAGKLVTRAQWSAVTVLFLSASAAVVVGDLATP